MNPHHDPYAHLPLREVELSVLLSVVDRPRHGYAILQEADERSGGRPGFEIPTLYRALRRMRKDGLIRPAKAPPAEAEEDARREYWQATALGGRVLAAELRRLEVLLAAGRARVAEASA
ncbi:MAG: helix-turn-helix transcriptional regulator [Gemmatimonadota bacterium]